MKIAIIGAGFTGLTAGYKLSQRGHQVTIFEKEKASGGLAAGFKEKSWDWSLEFFYHHLFPTDLAAKKLISELGLADKLFLTQPKTSIFRQGRIFQFDSAPSILSFSFLSLREKLRTGLITLYLQLLNNWQPLEKISASFWLRRYYGRRPFEILWQPLLSAKFGRQAEEIPMSWFWARIKKRSAKLLYFEGGFQILANSLTNKLKERGGKILLKQEVEDLETLREFESIIVTTPTTAFLKIAPHLPQDYQQSLKRLKMLSCLNLVLVMKQKFLTDNTYWLNINESDFPFVAVVEHTNFIDPAHYGGNHILYVGGYYPQNHPYFKMSKEQIFKEFWPFIKKINPNFHLNPITYHFFKSLCAQPLVTLNHSQIIPSHQTPLSHVYLANQQQVYPWDRGINYAIELGEKIADEITQK